MEHSEYLKYVDTLNEWSTSYYVLDNPMATDEEYDTLYRSVSQYETDNPSKVVQYSPVNRVGDKLLNGFKKRKHIFPMWSMQDIFTVEELTKWVDKITSSYKDTLFYCEPKFDGLSLNLIYKDGVLVEAISRGDGNTGEDVLHNAKTMTSIPLRLNKTVKGIIEIRGEVLIRKDDFETINEEQLINGKKLYANPRNAAAGGLRQLDPVKAKTMRLVFYPWGVGSNTLNHKLLTVTMDYIYLLGFLKNPTRIACKTVEDIKEAYSTLLTSRDAHVMQLDGMVCKVDKLTDQEDLGYTNKYPRWMCAYKFPAIEKTTTVLDVISQVGRTGVITPVAIIEPADMGDSVVSRVTLHNYELIDLNGLMIGDTVTVIRSGDVIPKIISIFKDRRDGSETSILRPLECPSCNSTLVHNNKGSYCTYPLCEGKLTQSLLRFSDRDHMYIDTLGEVVATLLIKSELVVKPLDLYKLTYDDLIKLEGFKDQKVNKLLEGIRSTIGISLEKLVASLGIRDIGRTASKVLVKEYGNRVFDLSESEFLKIDGMGDTMYNNYKLYISRNKQYIEDILEAVKPVVPDVMTRVITGYNGKSVVITGTLPLPRKEVIVILEEKYGMKVTSKVTSKTDLLICASTSGSKYKDAIKHGIEILTYEDFLTNI